MSKNIIGSSDLFDSARFYCRVESKTREFLEDIHATAHNLWGSLEGNTAETDVEWFARILYDAEDRPEGRRWDNEADRVREQFIRLSRTTIQELPRLMSRMANRAKHMAEAAKFALDAHKAKEGRQT
jgi:hypothetical protein